MVFLYSLYSVCLVLLSITVYYGVKYKNPYKLYMVFGKKGTGKTTLLVKLAWQYSCKGYTVYCTQPDIPNTILIQVSDIGTKQLLPNSLLLIDEVSLLWSNRDFKSFSKDVERFFRLQRHNKIIVYMFSQSFDIDKKIRDLVDVMFLSTRLFNCVGYMKRINKQITLTNADADKPSTIAENLVFDSILLAPFGSRKFTWIPKYAAMFDSFDIDSLPTVVGVPQRTASPPPLFSKFATIFRHR